MDAKNSQGASKRLLVNMCGWVEGLGAVIQKSIIDLISDKLSKRSQKLQIVQLSSASKKSNLDLPHSDYDVLSIKGDLPASVGGSTVQFNKGSVLRNYRLFDCLAPPLEGFFSRSSAQDAASKF